MGGEEKQLAAGWAGALCDITKGLMSRAHLHQLHVCLVFFCWRMQLPSEATGGRNHSERRGGERSHCSADGGRIPVAVTVSTFISSRPCVCARAQAFAPNDDAVVSQLLAQTCCVFRALLSNEGQCLSLPQSA